jgi:hypothetical protein
MYHLLIFGFNSNAVLSNLIHFNIRESNWDSSDVPNTEIVSLKEYAKRHIERDIDQVKDHLKYYVNIKGDVLNLDENAN